MALAPSAAHCRASFLLAATRPHLGQGEQCQAHDALPRLSYLAPETGRNDQIQGQTRLSTA